MPTSFARSTGRVSIDASVHEFYKQLASGKNPEEAPFLTMKDLFMLAACIGFGLGQRKQLGKREQPIHHAMLSETEDIPILKAIAIATTSDVMVLADPDLIIQIAEEYANSGIIELRSIVGENIGQPLWGLVDMSREVK